MKQSTFYYLLRRGVIGGGGSSAGPTNTVAPVISGTSERGETLTSTTGTWTGTGTITYAYQWKRSGANISGATSSTYVLVAADDNAFITCNITATDDTGSRSKLSNSLGPVLAAPFNLTSPVASGTAQVGETLSTTDGTWQGVAVITFAYQWRRDAVNISGATSSTYTLVAADYTTDVDCVVTATNSLGSASADSNDIANIAGTAPSISGVPTLSGTAKVGSTLTATAASVSGVPTPTTTFQWQRSDNGTSGWANISGATSSTYTAVAADEGKYLRAVQTSTNAVGSDSANSASSAQVAAAFTGLLDTYSGAAAAYSLRLLDSTYTGDAIVVTTNGSNSASIGFVNNELDTTSLEAFAGSGDAYVSVWHDQSGNGKNATQTSFSAMPKIVSNGSTITKNGKPTLEFDSSSSQEFDVSISISTTEYSNFIVEASDDAPNTSTQVMYGVSTSVFYTRLRSIDLESRVSSSPIINLDDDFAYTTSQQYLISIINGASQGAHYIDGSIGNKSPKDTSTSGGITSSTLSLASANGAFYFNGKIQEMVFYFNDESTNQTGIETNINDFYSIY